MNIFFAKEPIREEMGSPAVRRTGNVFVAVEMSCEFHIL
jgi:hypothetical protein